MRMDRLEAWAPRCVKIPLTCLLCGRDLVLHQNLPGTSEDSPLTYQGFDSKRRAYASVSQQALGDVRPPNVRHPSMNWKSVDMAHRVSLRLFDKPDGRLLAVHLNASCGEFLDFIPGFYMRFRTVHLNVHTVVSEDFRRISGISCVLIMCANLSPFTSQSTSYRSPTA